MNFEEEIKKISKNEICPVCGLKVDLWNPHCLIYWKRAKA